MSMIRNLILALLMTSHVVSQVTEAPAAYEAAFDKMLAAYSPTGVDSEQLAREFSEKLDAQLKQLGNREQNQAALWKVLKNKNKKFLWGSAMDLSHRLGISQVEVYEWAKANLEDIAMQRDGLAHFRLKDLISFSGTKADAERLLRIGDSLSVAEKEQADLIRSTARSIRFKSDPFPGSKPKDSAPSKDPKNE